MIHDHGATGELVGSVLGPRLVASRTANGTIELHRCARIVPGTVTIPPATEDDNPEVYGVVDPVSVQTTFCITHDEAAAVARFLASKGVSTSKVPA